MRPNPLLAFAAAGALVVLAHCSADLGDLDQCHAIAEALCNQSGTCPNFSLDHDTCVERAYNALPQIASGSWTLAEREQSTRYASRGGTCGLGSSVDANACIQAIQQTQCGGSVDMGACGLACESPLQVGVDPSTSACVPPGSGSSSGSSSGGSSSGFDSGSGGRMDASTTACQALAQCCANVPSTLQSRCYGYVAQTNQAQCQQYLASYEQAGYCP